VFVHEPSFNPFPHSASVALPAPEQLPPVHSHSFWHTGQRLLSGICLSLALVLLVAVAAGVVPLLMGWRPFVVVSGSMEPTIHTGAVALTRPVSSQELQVGDVIAYNPRGDAALPVIHRIVALSDRNGTRFVTTRGDANHAEDAEVALPPQALQVMGSIPLVGFAVYSAAQSLGTLLLIWIPLLLLAGLWLKDQIVRLGFAWRRTERTGA